MTYIQCTPTQPQLITVNRLEKSPLNARRTAVTIGMPEQIERLKRWLPEGMSFDLADAPKPVKARKGKTAA